MLQVMKHQIVQSKTSRILYHLAQDVFEVELLVELVELDVALVDEARQYSQHL